MRIAILGTRGFPSFYGGFETAVRELAPFFAKSGHQTFVYSRKASCRDNPHIENIEVIYSPSLNGTSLGTITHIMSSFVHIFFCKPDVILGFNVTCAVVGPITRMLGVPLVINVDGLEWRRQKWGRTAKFVYFFLAVLAAKVSTRVISDSENIQEYWQKTFNRNSDFIPYGGQECEMAALEDKDYFSDLLYVARFVPENSFDLFLDLVKILPKHFKVIMVGSFSNSTKKQLMDFSEFLSTYTNVVYLGHISNDEELFKYWKNTRVYFHGHTVGGTNPALVQAMHCGANILARNTVYNREVMDNAGHYFNDNLTSLAQIFYNMHGNDSTLKTKGEQARKRAIRLYSWDRISNEYLRLIEETIK